MELQTEHSTPQRPQRILYDTFPTPYSPTPPSPTIDVAVNQTPPPLNEENLDKSYNVFRNEIYLSVSDPCPEENTDTPDFLSLDMFGDKIDEDAPVEILEPVTPITPATPSLAVEHRMETGSWFKGASKMKKPLLKLHKEIMDFCDFLSPTPQEESSRNAAIKRVFDVIKFIWPDAKVEVFGSFSTGLYLPTSDIDVVILESGCPNPKSGLIALSKALSQNRIVKNMQVIAHARVPIVKFKERESGFAFDISFDVDNGPKAAEFIKEAMTKWPPLRPLCLILKVFLQQRDLNEVYSGGLGSYALLTMLMAVLQSVYDTQSGLEHNWGFLLVHFFEFYAFKLNTAEVGISCRGHTNFFSKRKRGFLHRSKPFLISIEDPQTPENDIGKNSFNYIKIRSAFASAYASLTDRKTLLSLGPNRSLLGTIINPDPILLDRKGGSDGSMTFSSLLPGAGVSLNLNGWEQQEITCNWQLDQEIPLPRGDGTGTPGDDDGGSSSRKKRKAAESSPYKTKKSSKKKIGENGEEKKLKREESGSKEGSSKNQRRRRRYKEDSREVSQFVAGSPYN
ncbi:hypothetical protein ACFE04_007677 [Oxalis oulophora]